MRLADRVAKAYAPVVHLTALATVIGWLIAGADAHDAIVTAITVLIITCPCALALAVPAVQIAAAGRLFRSGVFLNAGDALERLAQIDTVVFDKTGTLTLPEPRATNIHEVEPSLARIAGRLALSSRHPLARSLQTAAGRDRPFEDIVEEPGLGIRSRGDGIDYRLGSPDFCGCGDLVPEARIADPAASLIAVRAGHRRAIFRIRQTLRPDAAETITALKAAGLSIHIMSGDRSGAVAPLAHALGVEAWRGDMKPADKIAAVESLKREGRRVVMVGDGLNDAPALAAADASISPGDGG